jgi:hypothetical protein
MTTFSKLRNGSWGLRGKGLTEGSSVTVTKRSGETQTVVVGKVIWRGADGTCLAAKGDAPVNAPVSYDRRSSSNGRCRDCGGPIRNAPHHRAMGGLCGQCAFDEYDC